MNAAVRARAFTWRQIDTGLDSETPGKRAGLGAVGDGRRSEIARRGVDFVVRIEQTAGFLAAATGNDPLLSPITALPITASPITATTALTGATSPCRTRISLSTPAEVAGTSIDTLSVSISNRLSPGATVSPTDLNQTVILPSVTVSPSCGIRISIL